MSTVEKTPVSAVILTHNEEKYIARCLHSMTWADEILVVDSHSSDQTLSICEDKNKPWAGKIRVLKKEWNGFREQRNFAIKNAYHDWLLVVDADEECSKELAEKIRTFFKDQKEPAEKAYKVQRIEYFLGKPIRYGIWNPSYQDRFFHRKGVTYINDIHEYPKFLMPPGLIHEPLKHAEDFNVEKFLYKMNKYTEIEAMDRYRQGQRTNAFRLLTAFPAMFLKNYFYYKAYKDGMHGLIISLLEGVSRVVRHIKIWRISQHASAQRK